jgi:hypothetical protein
MNVVQKLRQLTDEVRAAANPASVKASWELAGRLLSRLPVNQTEATRVITARDGDGLEALVHRLEHPAPAAEPAAPDPPVSEEEMIRALKAFRKRLKLSKLSDESKLGGRHTTAGRASKIVAIQPPTDFEPHVWRALVAAGKLRDTGSGFFAEA